MIARLRLASPWTYLILAGLLGWVGGLLWAQLHRERRAEAETTTGEGDVPAPPLPRSPVHARVPDIFALLMIGLALLLAYSVEFVYLRDLFGTRMNTVFKFYYQAWVMLALAAAFGVSRLAGREVSWALKAPALLLTILLTGRIAGLPACRHSQQGRRFPGSGYARRVGLPAAGQPGGCCRHRMDSSQRSARRSCGRV